MRIVATPEGYRLEPSNLEIKGDAAERFIRDMDRRDPNEPAFLAYMDRCRRSYELARSPRPIEGKYE